ncbi:MAG TPA: hypothetical protein DCM28_19625 [Phycisphaerales bacterium]|nr:hypothetical protein [Phycisphaerales bacterium]HCD32867.1 hypothetical protein [Phycisphaerales bacterium]
MRCPKCQNTMREVDFEGLTIERCECCKGLWFDLHECKKLIAIKGSEIIDAGSPSVGEEHNKLGVYDCPKCLHRMSQMVDHQQPHIWYEQCPGCGGVYLDAGEFSDLKDVTVMDMLKGWFAKPRMS